MTANLTITAVDVKVVELIDGETFPAGVAITAGQAIRQDTTTGKWALALGDSAADAHSCRIACNAAIAAGLPVTGMKTGILSLGNALSALTYDDDVYLSAANAGYLADGTGGVDLIVGTVIPGWVATTPDKLLRVDL